VAPIHPWPRFALLWAAAALGAISLVFYYRQNFAGQLGGRMAFVKLLWLDYSLVALFLVPFFFWRSPAVSSGLRRIHGAHLASFAVRGVIELWLLYVTIRWIPPYGIAHDVFAIALITLLLARHRPTASASAPNRAARQFLTALRVSLAVEILLAWLFYRATGGRIGIYFADDGARFALINGLTWVAVLAAYANLARTLWLGRGPLLGLADA
jgi:hypothetical protein